MLWALAAIGTRPAPAFVDAGTGASEAPISGTLQVPYPATVAAGNFLLCQVYCEDSVGSGVTVPAGWTDIANRDSSGDSTHTMRAFYKIADGTETGNLDVTCTADVYAAGRIYRYSHGSGVEAAATAATDSSGTGMSAVSVTTLGRSRRVIQLLAADVNTTIGSISGATGATYAEEVAEYAAAAGFIISCQGAEVASVTATSGGSATLGSAGAYRLRIGFAIKP